MLTYDAFEYMEWLDIPLWVFNISDQRIKLANSAALSYWDAEDLQALQGRDFSDSTETVQIRLANTLASTLRGEHPTEDWTLYPKGKPTLVRLQSKCILSPKGEVELLFSANNVVANAKIQASKSLRRGIEAMRHTKLRIALYTMSGKSVMKNPSAENKFTHTVGNNEFQNLFEKPELAHHIIRKIQTDGSFSGATRLSTPTGLVWHDVDIRKIPDPITGTSLIQVNAHDITNQKCLEQERDALINAERKRLENEKHEAQGAMKLAIEAKRLFIACASHELRTPLQLIQSTVDLMVPEAKGRKKLTGMLKTLRDSARLLEGIAEDLGNFVHADQACVTPTNTNTCIDQLITSIAENYSSKTELKGLGFNLTKESDAPWVLVDEIKLKQITTNLLDNAINYTQRGSISLHFSCKKKTTGIAELNIKVIDTGIGMKEDDIPSYCQPFIRGKNSPELHRKGLGLGLPIVTSYVKSMKGSLTFQSRPGIGTEVTLSFRLKQGAGTKSSPIQSSSTVHVLVVDDDDHTRTLLNEIISEFDAVECYTASCGIDALKLLEVKHIDIALVDVQMPGMSGIELNECAKKRSLNPGIQIIGMSAFEVEKSEFDKFLAKPISAQKLASALCVSATRFS